MLITCEKCQAVYCIAEKIISPTGRMVKCARCQHVWMVSTDESIKYPTEPCMTLPILFKPALPRSFRIMPVLLVFVIIFINLCFFPEFFLRFQPFKDLYNKCGIYDSAGLSLDDFTFDLNGNELLVQGMIRNNSNEDKAMPELRYVLLNKDRRVIFRLTKDSSNKLIKSGDALIINSKIINLNEEAAYLQLDIGNKLELLLK